MAKLSPANPAARSALPAAPRLPAPGRACGSCTLCCKTVAVEALAKPSGTACPNALPCKGCAIYDRRPAGCREFYCEWMLSRALGPEWRPDRARFALMVTLTGHLAACVDPAFPAAWRRPPYYQALRHWARECAEAPWSAWPGVDVWIADRCIILLPDGEKDLGVIAADEEVRIDREMTAAGPVYTARKFARVQAAEPALSHEAGGD